MPCSIHLSTFGYGELAIGFPQAALDEGFGEEEMSGYPPWLNVATSWLEDMQRWLKAAVQVRVAAIGEEVSGRLED